MRQLKQLCELPFVDTGDHSLTESIHAGLIGNEHYGGFFYHPPHWKDRLTVHLV